MCSFLENSVCLFFRRCVFRFVIAAHTVARARAHHTRTPLLLFSSEKQFSAFNFYISINSVSKTDKFKRTSTAKRAIKCSLPQQDASILDAHLPLFVSIIILLANSIPTLFAFVQKVHLCRTQAIVPQHQMQFAAFGIIADDVRAHSFQPTVEQTKNVRTHTRECGASSISAL